VVIYLLRAAILGHARDTRRVFPANLQYLGHYFFFFAEWGLKIDGIPKTFSQFPLAFSCNIIVTYEFVTFESQ